MLEKQVRGLIIKFLVKVYPKSLTIKMIEALLYDWEIYATGNEVKLLLKHLIERGYVELEDATIPILKSNVKKVKLTEKGLLLYKGEIIDENVSFEGI